MNKLNKTANKQKSRKRSRERVAYLMLSPQIIGFFVFSLYPILWAFHKAFYYFNGIPQDTYFVAIENFKRVLFEDAQYWNSWLTTFKFAIYKMPFELSLALIIAIFLTKNIKGKGMYRALYYLPHIISVAIVGLIFSNLFDYFGFINAWLIKLGIIETEISWFAEFSTSMTVLVIAGIWSTFGINVLYFIAALSNVPDELYEAAELDGAGAWRKFKNITIPMIAPVFQTIILLSLNGTLHTSDLMLTLSGGAPAGKTFTVMSHQVSQFVPGFATGVVNIGYGCAMSIITSILMGAIALGYNRFSNKMQNLY